MGQTHFVPELAKVRAPPGGEQGWFGAWRSELAVAVGRCLEYLYSRPSPPLSFSQR